MGRGKLEIKKIENRTSRQVTFSKRRNGIMKKAEELTVLCDAKVSLIMISSTKKLHQYSSPGVSLKKMYDEYQKAEGVDIWRKAYEQMQEQHRKLLDINNSLRREISRRMGGDLGDMDFTEVTNLLLEMRRSVEEIRERKSHVIKTQTGMRKRKVRNLEERHGNLLMDLDTRFRGAHFGLHEVDARSYEGAAMYASSEAAAANLYALSRLPRNTI